MPEDQYWNTYARRFRVFPVGSEPVTDVPAMIVCIPVYAEPGLIRTLESLAACDRPTALVEVILLFNKSNRMTPDEIRCHDQAWHEALDWIDQLPGDAMEFHPVYIDEFPDPVGGVGWARKVVMDEAARRMHQEGVILCLDSDCTVSHNYLDRVLRFFQRYPKCGAASLGFEHQLESLDEEERAAIIQYELHLRYLVQANRWSGHPYAGHTVGSSMAVRRSAYLSHGGMNTRQAGEDFYFLQKFIETATWAMIPEVMVYPSARISGRVPFGTGRAMTKLKESGQPWLTTDPIVFEHIIPLFRQLDKLERWIRENEYASHISLNEFLHLHHEVAGFLEGIHFIDKCREIADHTASHEAFQKRFFRYFNAFMMIRYTHALTRSAYPEIPVTLAARTLAARLNIQGSDDADTEKLLDIYRHLDHYHAAVPK